VQLGRRFRALKLWMVIRAFGVHGLQARIREHCDLARELAGWVAADSRFEICAPVPFSTVCFRARTGGEALAEDWLNEQILAAINEEGPIFLSHTRLRGRIVLRLTVGNLRTGRSHVAAAWDLIRSVTTRFAPAAGAAAGGSPLGERKDGHVVDTDRRG
jgi:aromatic-L-amino-acid decarboxylase